jgi:GntR family transcriptional regulator, rspAB operon transcriptional repressor
VIQQTAPAGILPINHGNIRDDVYAVLRRGILRSDYPPGYRFDLNDLSVQLGISRTPVKEALHRLESEGLVDIFPRRGTFVTTLDAADIADGFGVRLALERYAADFVVDQVTDADIARLNEIRRRMGALLDAPEFASVVEQYILLDQDFHVEIISLARNRRLVEIYRTIGGPLRMARIFSRYSAADYRTYTEVEHAAIMQAILARDVVALCAAMTAHVERAQARISNNLVVGESRRDS